MRFSPPARGSATATRHGCGALTPRRCGASRWLSASSAARSRRGASASTPELRYGNRVAAWWRQKFPKRQVKFVNAGIGATGSDYGALRARRDLLMRRPDFVVVEYAVNDPNTKASAETLEGLVRQILKQPNQPAVVLLFTMHQNGSNAQEWHSKVGPALRPADGQLPRCALAGDRGRAAEVERRGGRRRASQRPRARLRGGVHHAAARHRPAWQSVPGPAAEARSKAHALAFVHRPIRAHHTGRGRRAATAHEQRVDVRCQNRCWKSAQPGSVIEFEIAGRAVLTMHRVIAGPMGRARVTVNGGAAQQLEGWFDQTWGGYRQTREIARDLPPGKHRVRFELLAEKSAGSTGPRVLDLRVGGGGCSGAG